MFQDPFSIVGIFKCESLQIAKSALENTLGEEVVLLLRIYWKMLKSHGSSAGFHLEESKQ